MISIAMTTYNGEKFLETQLLSILKQSRKPDEVIIVDDNSSDRTVLIIKHFIEKNNLLNWILIEQKENLGFRETFKNAIEKTNGKIIFLADQDDIWMENKIEVISDLMSKNKVFAISSSFDLIDEKDNLLPKKFFSHYTNNGLIKKIIKPNSIKKISLSEVINFNISPGCTTAFSEDIKKIYLKMYRKNFLLPHDWIINIIAAYNGGLIFYNNPLIKYRLHSNNTLGLSRDSELYMRIESSKKYLNEKYDIKNLIQDLNTYFNTFKGCSEINRVINFTKNRISILNYKKLFKYIIFVIKNSFFILKNNFYLTCFLDLLIITKNNKRKFL